LDGVDVLLLQRQRYAKAVEPVMRLGSCMLTVTRVWACLTALQLLQQHYAKVVEPVVEMAPAEQSACSAGLTALVRAVEERALLSLQAGVAAFFNQVCRWLPCANQAHLLTLPSAGDAV
jgi:hypothetical protein